MLPQYLGVLAAPLPLPFVQQVAQATLKRVLRKHPNLFSRLGGYANRAISVAPTDVPFEFNLIPAKGSVRVTRRGKRPPAYATRISGPLAVLMALAEGRLDGDAEFFGRKLVVEGDMEAALALRNAAEGARIDFVEDLASDLGPARTTGRRLLSSLRRSMLEREGVSWN